MEDGSQGQIGEAVASQMAQIQAEMITRHRELLSRAQTFSGAEEAWRSQTSAAESAHAGARQTDLAARLSQAAQRVEMARAAACRSAEVNARAIAPRFLSAPWRARAWESEGIDLHSKPCSWVRVGSLANAPGVPALLPLLNHAGWAVRASGPDFTDLLQGTILRLSASLPLHRFEVRVFDPALELRLGVFLPFRDASERSFAPATARVRDFEDALDIAVDGMSLANDAISAAGMASLEQHWAAMGTLDLPFRLIIINGYPQGITEHVQERLIQIARSAGTHGVSLVVRHDQRAAAHRDVNPRDLLGFLTAVDLTGTVISAAALPNTVVQFEGPPARTLAEQVVTRVVQSNKEAAAPTIPLSDLIAEILEPWSAAEFDGITATYGRLNRRPLALRLSTQNPPLPNALVGGAVGQGKSNLLLAIIHSLAARYRPDELRLYLLDFREGVEFAALGPVAGHPEWLPHAEVLGLESDRAFGVAVLEHLVGEMRARGEAFRRAGAASIVDYRRDLGLPMPRIVLVVDEFQVLLDGEGDLTDRAVAAFEMLARQGRGFGVHMIAASQTISGIRGLAVKGDAIFAQFPNRLSLKNAARESESILGPRNIAAAQIAYRGEIIHNEDSGAVESNQRGIVAWVDPEYARALRRELWLRAGGRAVRPPVVFHGAKSANWDDSVSETLGSLRQNGEHSDAYSIMVGRPISVDRAPLMVEMRRGADQGVALIGSGEVEGSGVLTAALVSLAAQASPGVRWIVLDGLSRPDLEPPVWLARCLRLGTRAGALVEHVWRDEIPDFLAGQAREMLTRRSDRDPDVFVIVLGAHMVRGLERVPTPSNDIDPITGAFPETPTEAPIDVLRDLVATGSSVGVFTIGWWPGLRQLQNQLGYDPAGIAAQVMFTLGRADLATVVGATYPIPDGEPRIVVRDPRMKPEARTAVPFTALDDATYEQLEGLL